MLGRRRMLPHRKMTLHIADCRSNSSKESLATPQYSIRPCFCCLLSSPHPELKEHAALALTGLPFLPWLQIQGGNQAARGWNVGGRKGWRPCLLPTNQRQLSRGFLRLVGVSLGEGLSALCSTPGSRST